MVAVAEVATQPEGVEVSPCNTEPPTEPGWFWSWCTHLKRWAPTEWAPGDAPGHGTAIRHGSETVSHLPYDAPLVWGPKIETPPQEPT